MKINVSFQNFKKKHILRKDQILFCEKKCSDYVKVENIFNIILSKKNSFILSQLKKGKIE